MYCGYVVRYWTGSRSGWGAQDAGSDRFQPAAQGQRGDDRLATAMGDLPAGLRRGVARLRGIGDWGLGIRDSLTWVVSPGGEER